MEYKTEWQQFSVSNEKYILAFKSYSTIRR